MYPFFFVVGRWIGCSTVHLQFGEKRGTSFHGLIVDRSFQELDEPLQQQLVEAVAILASTFSQWQRCASVETIEVRVFFENGSGKKIPGEKDLSSFS